ncbi:MAG: GSCFA domain-containing protein [Muribaculaceae bacterium]
MDFRTTISPGKPMPIIRHSRPVVMMGSCFTDNIGQRLADAMFDVTINPWGVMYNPVSIAREISYILRKETIPSFSIVNREERYYSLYLHSRLSGSTIEELTSNVLDMENEVYGKISTASAMVITFGSATLYRHITTGTIAGNCHKIPAKEFEIERLDTEKALALWINTIDSLLEINPDICIIFTVSPIRYKAYGLHSSTLDKARLLILIDQIQQHYAHLGNKITYFPAYEIMMDDLRDYRFYAADMIHPSDVAVDYIFDIFSHQYCSEKTLSFARECISLTKRQKHINITGSEKSKQQFDAQTEQIRELLLAEIQKQKDNEV